MLAVRRADHQATVGVVSWFPQSRRSAPAYQPPEAYFASDLHGQMQQVGGPCAGVNLIRLPAVD
jgi:hypothetical protein